jgi:hypothetical protein
VPAEGRVVRAPAEGGVPPADRPVARQAPQPPQVLIERIEVVTPPAATPRGDAFASLAALRSGAPLRAGGR